MQELKKEITEIQNKIRGNRDIIAKKELEVGNLLISSAPASLKNNILSELSREIQELLTLEPHKKKEISRILEIEEQIKKLHISIKEKKTAIGEKDKETKQHYRDIGAAAYAAYKGNTEAYSAYKDIFSELVNLESKAERANQQKNVSPSTKEQNVKENFFAQFFTMAKTIYYEKKEDFFTARQSATFKNTGKLIMDSDFANVADDAFLNEKVLPVVEIHAAIKQLGEDISALEQKINELSDDLGDLGVKGSSLRQIKEMEKDIEQNHHTLDQKYRALGKLYLDNEKELKLNLGELKNITTAIRGLESENEDYRKQIVQLNARIEVIKLQQKISRNQGNIESLKERMARDKEEIKDLTKATGDLEKKIAGIITEHKLEDPVQPKVTSG